MIYIFFFLILVRPFLSSLRDPLLDACYTFMLIAASLFLLKLNLRKLKSLPGQGFLLLFLLSLVLSSVFSLKPALSLQQLPRFLSYFFLLLAVYHLPDKEKARLMPVIVLGACAVSVYAIYWVYFGSSYLLAYMKEQQIYYPFALELLSRKRAFIPFVLPSMLAGYLIVVIPVSIGYLLEAKGSTGTFKIKVIFLSLAVLAMAYALFLTKSIGALLSLFFVSIALVLSIKVIDKKALLLLSASLVSFLIIFVLRSQETLYFTRPVFSLYRRLSYWQSTIALIIEHPLKGQGLGNFPLAQTRYAHNSYLQIWVESGILGIIGLIGFVWQSLKSLRLKALSTRPLHMGCLISYLGFLIHNLVDFSFFLPEVCTFWWIIAALFLSSVHANSRNIASNQSTC